MEMVAVSTEELFGKKDKKKKDPKQLRRAINALRREHPIPINMLIAGALDVLLAASILEHDRRKREDLLGIIQTALRIIRPAGLTAKLN